MKQDQWTQQLHDQLAQHETAAPDDLWADIEAALQQQQTAGHTQPSKAEKPSRSRFIALRRWAVAASLAAAALGGALLWWNQGSNETFEASQDFVAAANEQSKDGVPDGQASSAFVADSVPVSKTPGASVADSVPVSRTPGALAYIATAPGTLVSDDTTPEGASAGSASAPDSPASAANASASDSPASTGSTPVSDRPALGGKTAENKTVPAASASHTPTPRHANSAKPTLSLYAMNGFASKDNRNGIQMAPSLVSQYTDIYTNSNTAAARDEDFFQLADCEEHQHHYLPVSYGLTASYPITTRLSLTTGVVYTKLRSDFTQTVRSMQVQREQTLHYIGVPLTLSYSLWSVSPSIFQHSSSLRTYLSAGIKADWNVATHLETEGVVQQLPKDRMQWSFNGSLGVQYDIIPPLGLYVEPCLTWYPDNGSLLQNYFKDKPLSFNLQLGIRLNIGQ